MSVQAAHFPTEMYFPWSIVIIFLKKTDKCRFSHNFLGHGEKCSAIQSVTYISVTSALCFSPLKSAVDWFFLFPHMCEKNMAAPSTDVQLVPAKKPTGKLKTRFLIFPSPLQPFSLIEHLVELQYLASDDNVSWNSLLAEWA